MTTAAAAPWASRIQAQRGQASDRTVDHGGEGRPGELACCTCLVLTQRKDHIDSIVAGLGELGDDALVLRGGLGKKARAAVSDAIAARPPDFGIVLVATGSYLGEGFDWPELDTLFLAFPLAFKGRVVQYLGRLCAPTRASFTSSSTTTSTPASQCWTGCTASASPPTPPLGFDVPANAPASAFPSAAHRSATDPQ